MTAESDVLAAIEELEREEERRPWFEAPERAFRRGARMNVAPPPLEFAGEINGHGVFPDAVETHLDRGGYSTPSFRTLTPPPLEADDVRRIREWSDRTVRLSMNLRRHIYGGSPVVLLPREYPAMETVFGMRVHHVPIRGGYVGYRFDGEFGGVAAAMSTYWTLDRAHGEPWIVADRQLVRDAIFVDSTFVEPPNLTVRGMSAPAPLPQHTFSELSRMRVVELPSLPGDIFVGYSMVLPLISDIEREMQRRRDEYR